MQGFDLAFCALEATATTTIRVATTTSECATSSARTIIIVRFDSITSYRVIQEVVMRLFHLQRIFLHIVMCLVFKTNRMKLFTLLLTTKTAQTKPTKKTYWNTVPWKPFKRHISNIIRLTIMCLFLQTFRKDYQTL